MLVKKPESPVSEVIDGQQRLTTVTLLLGVLRDLSDKDSTKANLETFILSEGNEFSDAVDQPRLVLRDRDQPFFSAFVQARGGTAALLAGAHPATDAQASLAANVLAIRELVDSWTHARRSDFAKFLLKRTYLVVVSTPNLDAAQRIFSVMNSRGLDLSPADIFKAKVIGAVDEAQRATYAAIWESAEESLGRDDFADLFLHIRTIHAKVRAKRELLREFEDQVLDDFIPGKAQAFVDEVLTPYAAAYLTIRLESYSAAQGAEVVNAWLRRLNRLDNNDWQPVALWAVKTHKHNPDVLAQLLGKLERLAASMLVRRVYNTPRVLRYIEVLKELGDSDGTDAPSFGLTDLERKETLDGLAGEVYKTAPVRKYVLLRLDEDAAGQAGVTYDHKVVTVEHVLPQSPEATSDWVELFSDDERRYWVHRLANLVLLNRSKNAQAGRLDFVEKKDKYFRSKQGTVAFALTTQVVSEKAWTPGLLWARQDDLLARLRGLWRLDYDPAGLAPLTADDEEVQRVTVGMLLEAGLIIPGQALGATFKKRPVAGTVTAAGEVEVRGVKHQSLSAAASAATGGSINGWDFWHTHHEGRRVPLKELRSQYLGTLGASTRRV